MQAFAPVLKLLDGGEADAEMFAHGTLVEGIRGAGQFDLAMQRLVGNAEQRAVGHPEAKALRRDGADSISTAIARDLLMSRRCGQTGGSRAGNPRRVAESLTATHLRPPQ